MLLEKEKIRRIIRDHRISSFKEKDEDELINIFFETFSELNREQENKMATKEDIRMLVQFMDKRFEAVNKRFEAVDKRFEDMQKNMDKRFESINKRFEDMQKNMDKRFESIDKRFEDMQKNMDKRFESIDKRFEELSRSVDKRFSMLFIFMNIGFGIIILLVTLFKFLG